MTTQIPTMDSGPVICQVLDDSSQYHPSKAPGMAQISSRGEGGWSLSGSPSTMTQFKRPNLRSPLAWMHLEVPSSQARHSLKGTRTRAFGDYKYDLVSQLFTSLRNQNRALSSTMDTENDVPAEKILQDVDLLSDLTEDIVDQLREVAPTGLEIRKLHVTPLGYQEWLKDKDDIRGVEYDSVSGHIIHQVSEWPPARGQL
ncbi:hypothetical protein VTN77DRAFT_8900 [Rasamsonia byssochlamydoides]|uniref:uncharacterized protein n=1 Tax=Rasamsonia byssochlamydoides TaxID=89139 RepID=UPI003741FA7C